MVVVDLTEIDDDEMTDAEALERALALSMGDIEPNNKNAVSPLLPCLHPASSQMRERMRSRARRAMAG